MKTVGTFFGIPDQRGYSSKLYLVEMDEVDRSSNVSDYENEADETGEESDNQYYSE